MHEPATSADAWNPVMSAYRLLLCTLAVTTLIACGGSNHDASAQATPADVAAAVVAAAAASVATHPLCALVEFDEVSAVVGGHIARIDVIDDESLHSVDCVFLDPQDIYNGLSIKFVSTERLIKTSSRWPSALAYFEEWSRSGTAVAGLGDGAAWVDLPGGLLVHRRDHVLHLSADKADVSNAEVRARFETLARKVLSHLP